jgi:hypothetical protein
MDAADVVLVPQEFKAESLACSRSKSGCQHCGQRGKGSDPRRGQGIRKKKKKKKPFSLLLGVAMLYSLHLILFFSLSLYLSIFLFLSNSYLQPATPSSMMKTRLSF